MLFPAGVPDEAEILLADVGVTAGKITTARHVANLVPVMRRSLGCQDVRLPQLASKRAPRRQNVHGPKLVSNATGTPVYEHACRVAEYYEFLIKQESRQALYTMLMMHPAPICFHRFHAMWWCIVTMTTVGYGDKYPISWLGHASVSITAAMGIFFISMPLAIVSSSFANSCDKLQIVQDQKNAVKAAQESGFAAISFLNKSHALLIANNSMGQ